MLNEDAYVVTARLDRSSFIRLNGLRQRYFPVERNFLAAHLTLFHSLTLRQCEQVECMAGFDGPPLPVDFRPPLSIGRGVIVPVRAPVLVERHGALLTMLGAQQLTRQDCQPLRPHVTVQNKVTPEAARATLGEILADFVPWRGLVEGIECWRYVGGPWEARSYMPFCSLGQTAVGGD